MGSIWDGEDTLPGILWILTSIGSLNWGLVEFGNYNAVDEAAALLGSSSATAATIVYAIVAIAGAVTLLDHLGLYDVTDFTDSIMEVRN